MSEWLTTGQMIDQIKKGESAECVDNPNETECPAKGKTVSFNGANIFWDDQYKNKFFINDFTMPLKWRILPKPKQYVAFEEAMKAFRDGNTVTCYSKGLIPHLVRYNLKEDGVLRAIHYERILEGKWQIIE